MTEAEARTLTKWQRTRARARGEQVPFLPRWRGGRRRMGAPIPQGGAGNCVSSPCLVLARTGRLCSYCRRKAAMFSNAIKKLDGTHYRLTDEDRRRGRLARGLDG